MPTGPLAGKVAFATGAGRGLCKAIVERYLRDGASVLALDHHEQNLQTTVAGWRAANPAWGERVLPWVGERTGATVPVGRAVATR